MNNFAKSSVKLLPIIENTDNRVTFYTEFDGEFVVGDKLYIAVNNTGITEYTILDSMANTGYTNSDIGYELLQKDGNRIVLDIKYDTFILNNLTEGTCFIGRVYITNSEINRGVINGCLIKDTSTQPLSKSNIEWKQGILFDTLGSINNIDFNSKSDDTKLILKTIINSKGEVESFYTYNNYGIGLSIINLSDNIFQLNKCNINAGVFNNCTLTSNSNEITGGDLYDCYIGDTYIINGGRFVNCELQSANVLWFNGTWNNDYTGTTINNPYKTLTWEDGTWEDGIFPVGSTWLNGRFKDGTFMGLSFNNGEFDNGIIDGRPSGVRWAGGIFNNGTIYNIIWENGIFNNGVMIDTRWKNGTFNNGAIYSTSTPYAWDGGVFNDGIITNMGWVDGVFNYGIMSGCTWATGEWYDGKFTDNSTWSNGEFYNGEFENSVWENGKFYNGLFKDSRWVNGTVYYGVFLDMDSGSKRWVEGIWYNGTMNNVKVIKIEWYNGIANDTLFGINDPESIINWYNGTFNSGTFGYASGIGEYTWYDGKFYYGAYNGGDWQNGTFYTGEIGSGSYINPKYKINKPFKPFNEYGSVKKSNRRIRHPRKRRTMDPRYNR